MFFYFVKWGGLVFLKNYALDEEKKMSFVLKYKLEDDNLVIEYADGEIQVLPYSIENEKELLRRMKRQVLEADEMVESANDVCRLVRMFSKIFLMVTIATMFYYVFPVANSITDILVVELAGLLFASPIFVLFKKVIKDQKELIKDINKNKLFIDNELLFQSEITKDMELDKNIDSKVRDVINLYQNIEKSNMDIVRPNINDIDDIPYDVFMDLYDVVLESSKNKTRVLKK